MLTEILSSSGLQTNVNQLRQEREGGLLTAQDIMIRKPGVVERRPGLLPITAQGDNYFLGLYNQFLLSFSFDGSTISSGAVESGASQTSLTSSAPVLMEDTAIGRFLRAVNASNGNYYYLTQKGPYKISYAASLYISSHIPGTSAPVPSGVPRGLDVQGVLTGASGFLSNNSNVAYQIVFGYTDPIGLLNLGSPSETVRVSNSAGGTRNVSLTFSLPRGLTTSFFYQIYRSDQTGSTAVTAGVNFQLVAQVHLAAGDISSGYVTVTDSLPDTSRGAFLYADATQEGALQTNDPPPLCTDIVEWNGMTFYLNPTLNYSTTINLVLIGGSGLVADDVVTISPGNFTYTAKATQNDAAHQFAIATGGTTTENIIQTAKNLVECINRDTRGILVHARYVGSLAPGEIYLENDMGNYSYVGFLDAYFTITCARSSAFSPSIGISTPAIATMTNQQNAIYVSKVGLPECVPLTNVVYAGTGGTQVYRGFGLLDALYIFTRNGVYRITGSTPNTLSVSILYPDVSGQLLQYSANMSAVLDGSIYCLTSQGVLSINGSGKTNVSIPIEDKILATSLTFGFSHNSFVNPKAKEYAIPTSTGLLVYNYLTQTWTTWSLTTYFVPNSAIYDPITGKMFYVGAYGVISYESPSSYFDARFSRMATSTSGDNILVDSSINVVADDILWDGTTATVVTSVPDGTHIKVSPSVSWTSHAFWVCKTYTSKAQYTPMSGGMASPLKRFENLAYHVAGTAPLTLGVSSDLAQTESTVVVTPALSTLTPIRILTPTEQARAHWLMMSVSASAYNATFALHGVSVEYEPISMRGK
jgi:hypothetical protein